MTKQIEARVRFFLHKIILFRIKVLYGVDNCPQDTTTQNEFLVAALACGTHDEQNVSLGLFWYEWRDAARWRNGGGWGLFIGFKKNFGEELWIFRNLKGKVTTFQTKMWIDTSSIYRDLLAISQLFTHADIDWAA